MSLVVMQGVVECVIDINEVMTQWLSRDFSVYKMFDKLYQEMSKYSNAVLEVAAPMYCRKTARYTVSPLMYLLLHRGLDETFRTIFLCNDQSDKQRLLWFMVRFFHREIRDEPQSGVVTLEWAFRQAFDAGDGVVTGGFSPVNGCAFMFEIFIKLLWLRTKAVNAIAAKWALPALVEQKLPGYLGVHFHRDRFTKPALVFFCPKAIIRPGTTEKEERKKQKLET